MTTETIAPDTSAAHAATRELAGKRVLVTGGTRGIGRAITLAAVRAGADVIACHRSDSDASRSLQEELDAADGDHHLLRADLAREADVRALAAEVAARAGRVDAIICNAGAITHTPLAELDSDTWHTVLDTNLTAPYLLVRELLPVLADGASVVFLGSRVAERGVPLRAHYTASKAGLSGLARGLCKELGPERGIRFNVLAPGIIETEEAAKLPPKQYDRYRSITALTRLGAPEEVAAVAVFLAGDRSSYVNGTTIDVDGGI